MNHLFRIVVPLLTGVLSIGCGGVQPAGGSTGEVSRGDEGLDGIVMQDKDGNVFRLSSKDGSDPRQTVTGSDELSDPNAL